MSIVITVSRQLGSRGSYIAAAVAKKLGLRYIDREILNRTAEVAGYPDEAMVSHLEQREKVPGFLERVITSLNAMPMIPTIASATLRESYAYDEQVAILMVQDSLSRDEAFQQLIDNERRVEAGEAYDELIRQVILEYANAGNVIIVGRGGQVVLRDYPNALHVRVQASEKLRVRRLTERLGLDDKEAERQIRKSDKERARYMKHFYNVRWDDPDLYHLIVNTGKVSVDIASQIIADTAQRLARQIP